MAVVYRKRIDEVADVTKLAGFEFTKHMKYTPDGEIIAIRALNLKNGQLILDDVQRVSAAVSDLLPRSKLNKYDIVLSYTGTIGESAQIMEDGKYHLAPNVAKIVPNSTIDPQFLFQYIRSREFKKQMLMYAHGSTQPTIPMATIRELTVPVFSLEIQRRIANLLSIIDKKISTNQTINDNLEQQAMAVFRSWFVDFKPFSGNAPEAWQMTTLGSVCSCELGGTPSRDRSDYWNGDIPWINSGAVNQFRIIFPSEYITELGLNKSATKLLPAKTTVIAITGATLGQVSLLEIASCANQSVVGVIPSDRIPYEFILPVIKTNIKELTSHQTGGAQQHINKQNVENLPVLIPPETVLKEYVSSVGGMYAMIANNCFENHRLERLRDTLLPRLMSGELDVSEVEL